MLLVDDDNDDLSLLKHAIIEVNPAVIIDEAPDGEAAIQYLEIASGNGQLPFVVVLDLNMPKLNGRETIEIIKQHDHLKQVPVVVFTTSENADDRKFCEAYEVEMITKPFNMRVLYENARRIISYLDMKT